jgi:hypothetical protein
MLNVNKLQVDPQEEPVIVLAQNFLMCASTNTENVLCHSKDVNSNNKSVWLLENHQKSVNSNLTTVLSLKLVPLNSKLVEVKFTRKIPLVLKTAKLPKELFVL